MGWFGVPRGGVRGAQSCTYGAAAPKGVSISHHGGRAPSKKGNNKKKRENKKIFWVNEEGGGHAKGMM